MNSNFLNRRIPSLFGIFLLIVGIIASTILVQYELNNGTNANVSDQPQQITLANITDSSFTVVYVTSAFTPGSISYGLTPDTGSLALDERDTQTGNPTSHNVHYVTVKNLAPNSTYYFAILSGTTTYDNSGKPYSVTTGSNIGKQLPKNPSKSGKILLPDGSAPQEAVVFGGATGSQTIAALAKTDGSFSLPLSGIRNSSFTDYVTLTSSTIFNLTATNGISFSQVSFNFQTTNDIPPITLSQNYNFSQQSQPSPTSANTGGFSSQASKNTTPGKITITIPSQNQKFISNKPLFKGTAMPSENVNIFLDSTNITAKVIADKNGNWSYQPDNTLAVDNHTLTINSQDTQGSTQTVSKNFAVLSSGSQVAQSATPSATLIPTSINKPTPTITSSATPSVNNTGTPTLIPTITNISENSPTPTIAKTGAPETIVGTGIVGIVISVIGGLLFFAL